MKQILETERLLLREMTLEDFEALCKILQDKEVMTAYEHAFSDAEVENWLHNQLNRYSTYGFGLWAVLLKETGEMIGQCGLSMQDSGQGQVLEVGYLFQKAYWHQGYAIESAKACRDYAFMTIKPQEVYSIIRDINKSSQAVAEKNAMTIVGTQIRHYYNIAMPHHLYCITKAQWEALGTGV